MPDELQCAVCDNEPAVGVASSPLAPYSVAYGRRCLDENAEPLWLVHATIELVGGPEHVAEWVKTSVRSYNPVSGRYLDWAAILSCYVPPPDPGPWEPPPVDSEPA